MNIMKFSLRDQAGNFFAANQTLVAGTVLFLFAYSVFAANAIYKQPFDHPQPIWKSDISRVDKTEQRGQNKPIPVRRVETSKFPSRTIPVPVLRPEKHLPNESRSKPAFAATTKDVEKVQHLLEKLNFYSGPFDGLLGPQTNAAIRNFEKSKILPQTGAVSPALIILLENTVKQISNKNTSLVVTTPAMANAVSPDPGMITRIQVGLINFGIGDVAIDGVMGNNTKTAIEQFQKRFNLNVTGLPNKELIRKLESVGALTRG